MWRFMLVVLKEAKLLHCNEWVIGNLAIITWSLVMVYLVIVVLINLVMH